MILNFVFILSFLADHDRSEYVGVQRRDISLQKRSNQENKLRSQRYLLWSGVAAQQYFNHIITS